MDTQRFQTLAATLPEDQQNAFRTFVQHCHKMEVLQRPRTLQKGDLTDGLNDEYTLLRFLRARSFDVNGAYEQFKEALALRKSVGAIITYETIDIDEFEMARNLYPHWSGCRDRTGMPICIFDTSCLDDKVVDRYNDNRNTPASRSGGTISKAMQHAIVFNDYLTRFVLPVCSAISDGKNSNTAITSAVYVVDVSTLTMKQVWSLREYVQDFNFLLSTCYPEVIDRIYVVNAPSYFGMIWNFVRKWIDPRTASKVQIVFPAQVLSTLLSTIDVAHIPLQYGGEHCIQYGMPPKVDNEILQSIVCSPPVSINQLPIGPIKLSITQHGKQALIATGTAGGNKRQDLIGLVKCV
ncbi:CRAL-TRIO domain-containing protein [Mariannaea sp. PMI_226]|nr:CRAL-TRIO domain-containing protein [Mariannaea sp. PMI_226]